MAAVLDALLRFKFAANGATLRILDVNLNDAEAVTKEILSAGGSASAHACDVTEQRQVISTFDNLSQHGRIHILVNNAGISQIGNVEATPEDSFDRIIRVNVKGYYNCIYAGIGHMKAPAA